MRRVRASVAGKVVVITGGARGIGYATAAAFVEQGARVAIGDIDETVLKSSAEALGLEVYGPLDVTDPRSFEGFLDDVERRLGPVDILVNNAGIMPVGRLVDETDDVTRRIIDINVIGVITGSKLAARRMAGRGGGHVINVASIAGEIYAAGMATYCASKFAVVGFTDAARLEHRASGVCFSLVMPTFTNTELVSGVHGAPGMRNAEPEEIAAAIIRLAQRPRRRRVRVTKVAGAASASQKFLGQPLSELLARRAGGDRFFLDDVDPVARRAYEERVRRT